MVATNFEGLIGYRTLRDECQGQAPLKAYDCFWQRFLGFYLYCNIWHVRAIPIHTESTDSVIMWFLAFELADFATSMEVTVV